MSETTSEDYCFLKACRGEATDHVPIWIMRQAGRYLPEYQAVRKKVDFLTLCKTPELAAEVTIQPIDILGVDAAILFSDILIPIEAMGMKLDFTPAPLFESPIRTAADLDKLVVPKTEESMGFVLETIRILRRELEGRVPLIGFSGAPWTLLTYMIEGGPSKNFDHSKGLLYNAPPEISGKLLRMITDTVIDYLSAQVRAGAQAVQLFESWGGILAPQDYRKHILLYTKEIIETIQRTGVPVIYYLNGVAGLLEDIKTLGADVYGIDWRIDLGSAIGRLGSDKVVQGNMDPIWLFKEPADIREGAGVILEEGKKAKAHIFNLGHGILPHVPVAHAKALVDAVHELSRV